MKITYRPQAEIIAKCFGIPVELAAKIKFKDITPPFIRFVSEEEVEVAEEYRDNVQAIENAINLYKEKVSV